MWNKEQLLSQIQEIQNLSGIIEDQQIKKEELISILAQLLKEKLLPPEKTLILIKKKEYDNGDYIEYWEYYLTPNGEIKIYMDNGYTYDYYKTIDIEEFLWGIDIVKDLPKLFETYLNSLKEKYENYKKEIETLEKAIKCLKEL